jgi:hypothetical protein
MSGRARGAVVVVAIASAGCADVARRAVTPVDDYDAYRRFRIATTVERKLAHAFDYLQHHAHGVYEPDVRAWFSRAQAKYVKDAWDDPPRLDAFLKSVPRGEDADRAAARLVQLEVGAEYQARRDQAFDVRVARLETRLATAESGRRELVSGLVRWVRRLVAIKTWGGRTSELDSETIFAYRLEEPGARCYEDSCVKTILVPYSIPEGKAQSEREAVYDVELRLEKGGVAGAFVTGPELFTRLGEAVRVAAVSSGDFVARAEAIGQAAQVVAMAIEPALPAARCSVEAVSPIVLHRRCDGLEVRVISAMTIEEEDRIVVEPVR